MAQHTISCVAPQAHATDDGSHAGENVAAHFVGGACGGTELFDVGLHSGMDPLGGIVEAEMLKQHGGGHLAVISSIAGTKGLGIAPAYSATKRFQNTYIDALEQLSHLQKLNIRFTDIRPGFVATALLGDGKHYPMLMKADKVGQAITRALNRKRRTVIIDGRYRVLVFFWRLIPRRLWKRLPVKNKS